MRSSVQDQSSLFLLQSPRSTAEPVPDYVLQATGRRPGVRATSADLFDLVAPRGASPQGLASAVELAMTIDEPTFFADTQALETLVSYVFPRLLPSRRFSQSLRLWSPGCATGQGTYSLAITLAESCPSLRNWDIQIVASDSDPAALARAQRGIYSSYEVQRGLPIELLVRHFEQLPAGGTWRFQSPLRAQMSWLQLDLTASCAPVGAADIVFCPQRLGELDQATRGTVLGRLVEQVASDGFLILAMPEAVLEHKAALECVRGCAPAVYRRIPREASLLSA
jgi:chemotaxis protein methyltransferase CheR